MKLKDKAGMIGSKSKQTRLVNNWTGDNDILIYVRYIPMLDFLACKVLHTLSCLDGSFYLKFGTHTFNHGWYTIHVHIPSYVLYFIVYPHHTLYINFTVIIIIHRDCHQ